MPAAPRITPQDPSYSPTYNLSTTGQAEHTIPPSLRRNLFSAHLSRRPVSHTTANIFGPPSPTHQNASPRQDVFSSGPTLHPTKRMMDLKDIYDPDPPSPNRGASPSAVNNLFPRESIIAVNPLTGRPLLPNLPTLPARLRLSEDDDDDDEEDGDEGSDGEIMRREHLEYGQPYTRSPSHARNFMPSSDFDFDPDIDLDSSDLNFIGIPRRQNPILRDFVDSTDDEENRRGRERIERLLAEMMSRQRARARTLVTTSDSSTHFGTSGSISAVAANGTRTTRAGKARETKAENSSSRYDSQRSATEPAIGGVGATMDPLEKDELMGLIMTSLRRKLQQAEDESWMYGGAEGLGGIGIGAEAAGDGIYE